MAHFLIFGSLYSTQISSTIWISPFFSSLNSHISHSCVWTANPFYCLVHLEVGICQDRETHSTWKPCVFSQQNTIKSPLIAPEFSPTPCTHHLCGSVFLTHSGIFLFHIITSVFSISRTLEVQFPANLPSSCFWAILIFKKERGDYIMCPFHHSTYF